MKIKPGDVVGFSGTGKCSIFINLMSYGIPRWGISHVGIIGAYHGENLLFESTTLSNVPCVIQGKPFRGTQAVRLADRVAKYKGRIWLYPLYRKLYTAEADRLNEFLIEHIGLPYDHVGAINAGGEVWSWFGTHIREECLKRIFCSELCAAAHREIGLIRTNNVSSWNPNRFIRSERWHNILAQPRRLK